MMTLLPELVYLLCAAMSTLCAVLLLRQYRRRRSRLLLWSALCFLGFIVNNALLVVDLVLLPQVDLALWRAITGAASVMLLLYGLVSDQPGE